MVVDIVHDASVPATHAELWGSRSHCLDLGIVARGIRVYIYFFFGLSPADGGSVLFFYFLGRVMCGRGGVFDPMIDLRSFGVADAVAGAFLFLAEARSIVDGAGTGVILVLHVEDRYFSERVLFFWVRGRVKAGAVR